MRRDKTKIREGPTVLVYDDKSTITSGEEHVLKRDIGRGYRLHLSASWVSKLDGTVLQCFLWDQIQHIDAES